MTLKTKCCAVWVMTVAFAGAAFAQSEGGSAAPAAAGSAALSGSAAGAPVAAAPPPAAAPSAPGAPATDARKACTDAMNADPTFAAAIVKVADEKAAEERDAATLAAHVDANLHVQKNQRHVLYAYAAMWVVAAAFVIFLWRRQQALKREIANLRRDLDAAADEPGAAKAGA